MKITDYFLITGGLNVIISAIFWDKLLIKFEAIKSLPTFVAVLIHFVTGFLVVPIYVCLLISISFLSFRYYFLKIVFKFRIWRLNKSKKQLKDILESKFKRIK